MMNGFHHVVLFCLDTGVSKAWYERAGFEYLRGYNDMHWFSVGPAEVMLHPSYGQRVLNSPHLHAGVSDLDALFSHIVKQGLKPFDHQQESGAIDAPITRAWGDREFELEDPDGYRWIFTAE